MNCSNVGSHAMLCNMSLSVNHVSNSDSLLKLLMCQTCVGMNTIRKHGKRSQAQNVSRTTVRTKRVHKAKCDIKSSTGNASKIHKMHFNSGLNLSERKLYEFTQMSLQASRTCAAKRSDVEMSCETKTCLCGVAMRGEDLRETCFVVNRKQISPKSDPIQLNTSFARIFHGSSPQWPKWPEFRECGIYQ